MATFGIKQTSFGIKQYICGYGYFWAFCSVLLFYLSILVLIPHILNYYSFIVLKCGKESLTILFFSSSAVFQLFLALEIFLFNLFTKSIKLMDSEKSLLTGSRVNSYNLFGKQFGNTLIFEPFPYPCHPKRTYALTH